jgi:hypothetical protein
MIQLENVKELLRQAHEPTLSLYVNVDPALRENQAEHPAWSIWLKNRFKQLEESVNAEQRPIWDDLRARVNAYFDYYTPESKGLALFYTAAESWAFPLPVNVENTAAFGKPLITPLLWVMDEYEPYLILMVDHEKARFMVAYLGAIGYQETAVLELDTSDWAQKTTQTTSGAVDKLAERNARDDFDRRVDQFTERFYEEVAHHAGELALKQHARRVILGGNEESAHAVQKLLPDELAKSVVAVLPIPMRYNTKEILDHVTPTALEYERQQEMALVEQVIGLAKAKGRALTGREPVLDALKQHRVELLILPWPTSQPELSEEMTLMTFESGGSVELVRGAAAERLIQEGGWAVRLYYTLEIPVNS